MKIKAAVVWEKGHPFNIEEVDLEGPKDGEVLIKTSASGICHTDVVAQTQEIPVPLPAVFGHEGSGVIVELGPGVRSLKKGDHVAASYAYCGDCDNCIAGHYAKCERMGPLNFGGVMDDGTTRLFKDGKPLSCFFGQSSFAEYMVVNQRNTVKIDPDIPLVMAAPLGCGVQTGAGTILNRFKPPFGSTIAVLGCGSVGMSAIMAARLIGCSRIIAVGGNPQSLVLAREIGATDAINRKEVSDLSAVLKELSGGGLHYLFDTSGVLELVTAGLKAMRPGSTFCSVGASFMSRNIPLSLFMGKNIVSVTEGDAVSKLFIPQMIDYYKAGRFPIDKLISCYEFKDINQAIQDSHDGKIIKGVITF
jgi:aryl-alcohol dehydrogenase